MSPTIQSEFRDLAHRNQLGQFLNARNLKGKFVEVGSLHGDYAKEILKTWEGHLICVDPWKNQDKRVYNDQANDQNMEQLWKNVCRGIGQHQRCSLYRMLSLTGVGKFEDGKLDGVYLDGNHAVDAVRDDIMGWWPKVKIGGIVSGHDFFTRYDSTGNCDALTAVMELAEVIGVRPHVTWCSSWWFTKTEEADERFRLACEEGRLARGTYCSKADYDMVMVMPIAKFDWNLAVKWLMWYALLRCSAPNKIPLVLLVSPDLTHDSLRHLNRAAETLKFHVITAKIREKGYFGTPNQMFKAGIEFVEKEHPGKAMLWIEADTVPMSLDFAELIQAEYRQCGRPFMGDINRDNAPHLTGNAVYHPNWRALAPSLAALSDEECGWDALCSNEIVPRSHVCKSIQQVWRPPLPITQRWVDQNIRPTTALFHQCKDGSLIDVLSAAMGLPKIQLLPALAESTYAKGVPTHVTQLGPEAEVFDRYATPEFEAPPLKLAEVVETPVPPTEILIVTHFKDVKFLRRCLESIKHYASGFSGTTLLIPKVERHLFDALPGWVKVRTFDEVPGKGVMHHVLMKCRSDELLPEAHVILHVDADCLFWHPFHARDLMPDGRPIIVRESYKKITNSNRFIWRDNAKRALGFAPMSDTMVRHPNIYHRDLYGMMRAKVEEHTGMPFDTYAMSGKNEFPQSFQEFITLGAVACEFQAHKYTIVDYDHDRDGIECGVPAGTQFQYLYRPERDVMVEAWSHGGFDRYREDWAKFLKGHLPKYYVK